MNITEHFNKFSHVCHTMLIKQHINNTDFYKWVYRMREKVRNTEDSG